MASWSDFEDLRDHLSDSMKVIEHITNGETSKIKLNKVLEKVTDHTTLISASENLLSKLQEIVTLTSVNDNVNSFYAKLKEDYSNLEQKYNNVVVENKSLIEKYHIEKMKLQNKIQQLGQLVEQQTKASNHEEAELVQQINTLRFEVDMLNEKLQVTENAKAALHKQLTDFKNEANSNLKDANNKIYNLQMEVQSKNQHLYSLEQEQKKPTNLAATQKNEDTIVYNNPPQYCIATTVGGKYPTLNVGTVTSHKPKSNKTLQKMTYSLKQNSMPLKKQNQASDVGGNQNASTTSKKIKLFNPGCMDYLNNFDGQ